MVWYLEAELGKLDRQTIGTEKVSLKIEKQEFGVNAIDNLLSKVSKISKERMFIAYEYFKNMSQVLNQCYKLLKSNGFMVLVVGNNKIGEATINTAKLLTELAKKTGFDDIFVLKR